MSKIFPRLKIVARPIPRLRLGAILLAAALALPLLHAQSSAVNAVQPLADAPLPPASASMAGNRSRGGLPILPAGGMENAIPAFGSLPTFAPFHASAANAAAPNPNRSGEFRPGAGFAGSTPGAPSSFNMAPIAPGSALFGANSSGPRPRSFTPLFQASTQLEELPANPGGTLAAPGTPSLNQLMRRTVTLPAASPFGVFRFSYQDTLHPDGSPAAGEFGRPAASAMFTSTSFGNGVFFSAGTSFGRTAGASTIPGAERNTGTPKTSSTGVALKLSF